MGKNYIPLQVLTAADANGFAQLTDLAAGTGATLVGTSTGTVQGDLTARPTSASLAASGGASLVGTTTGTVQTDLTARPTSISLAASGGAGLIGYSQGVPGSKTSGTTGSQLDNLSASGATASRPTPAFLGQPYFDTTLGQPIWCSSISPVTWVNAAGVSV